MSKNLLFGNRAKTVGFIALTCGVCASALTASVIAIYASTRMCLLLLPPKCYGGIEMALTNSSSIFNIYFLIIWITLAFVGLTLSLKAKFWDCALPEKR